jgi:hypothetical protein
MAQPISNYVDPNWYNEVRQLNLFGGGPVKDPAILNPADIADISTRTLARVPGSDALEADPNFNAVRNVQDVTSLNSAGELIESRALESRKREEYSIKNVLNSFPKEYSYTTNIEKLKDRLVLILHSPDASSNPGINRQNRDQQLLFDTIDFGSNLVEGIADGVKPFTDRITEYIDDVKKNNQTISKIAETGNKFLEKTKQVSTDLLSSNAVAEAKQKFEYLNSAFYTSGSRGDKYKIIYLPMPQGQLVDSHSHSINGVALNPALPLLGLAAYALDSVLPGGGGVGGNSRGTASRGFSLPGSVGEYLLNAGQVNARKAINPAQETLYQSPVPRQWQFTITYAPTSKDEAESFIKIIEILKQHSYPTIDAAAVIFNFPGTVDFYFVVNEEEQISADSNTKENIETQASKVLPRSLFPCFIKSVQVNYINESGYYTHFWDGNPTTINLTLDIVESKLLTRESLDKNLTIGSGTVNTPLNQMDNMQRSLDDVAPLDRTFR